MHEYKESQEHMEESLAYPREKLRAKGISMLPDTDLVKLLLGICRNTEKNNRMILETLKAVYGSKGTDELFGRLMGISGFGEAKAGIIAAGLELQRRRISKRDRIKSPDDCYRALADYVREKQEYFITLPLNGANEIMEVKVVSIGLANQTIIHPREVFARVIELRAINVILVHNHPSGDLRPSEHDVTSTRTLVEAGKIVGIKVLDHIIISENGFYSFAEHGMV